jgi:nitronate monooxygenase
MKLPALNIGDMVAKLPIIQGGMGVGVSLSGLAGAVAAEGGVGIISSAQVGFREDDFATNAANANIRAFAKEIKKAREIANGGIVGVNIMVATTNYADMVMTAVREKIDIIISGAGLPKNLPELVKGSDVKIAPIVSSKRAAETIIKLWQKKYNRLPDLVVVEGPEAGGHLGFSKEDLVSGKAQDVYEITREVKSVVGDIPVISAGGIFSGADIKKALDSGASGVQMATRFVATEECDANPKFKEMYLNAKEGDIELVKSPVGLPGRAIRNPLTKLLSENDKLPILTCSRCINGCNPSVAPYCITDALIKAVQGDTEKGLFFVGSSAYRLDKIITVKELIREIEKEYDEATKS